MIQVSPNSVFFPRLPESLHSVGSVLQRFLYHPDETYTPLASTPVPSERKKEKLIRSIAGELYNYLLH